AMQTLADNMEYENTKSVAKANKFAVTQGVTAERRSHFDLQLIETKAFSAKKKKDNEAKAAITKARLQALDFDLKIETFWKSFKTVDNLKQLQTMIKNRQETSDLLSNENLNKVMAAIEKKKAADAKAKAEHAAREREQRAREETRERERLAKRKAILSEMDAPKRVEFFEGQTNTNKADITFYKDKYGDDFLGQAHKDKPHVFKLARKLLKTQRENHKGLTAAKAAVVVAKDKEATRHLAPLDNFTYWRREHEAASKAMSNYKGDINKKNFDPQQEEIRQLIRKRAFHTEDKEKEAIKGLLPEEKVRAYRESLRDTAKASKAHEAKYKKLRSKLAPVFTISKSDRPKELKALDLAESKVKAWKKKHPKGAKVTKQETLEFVKLDTEQTVAMQTWNEQHKKNKKALKDLEQEERFERNRIDDRERRAKRSLDAAIKKVEVELRREVLRGVKTLSGR
ncbi:unnamed protein product, partial [marine sediment metagenome]